MYYEPENPLKKMKYLIIRKLNNVSNTMIKRLFSKAKDLGLLKKDLMVETSEFMIKKLVKSYTDGLKFGECLSIKSFVKDAQKIIDSLVISKEDFFAL